MSANINVKLTESGPLFEIEARHCTSATLSTLPKGIYDFGKAIFKVENIILQCTKLKAISLESRTFVRCSFPNLTSIEIEKPSPGIFENCDCVHLDFHTYENFDIDDVLTLSSSEASPRISDDYVETFPTGLEPFINPVQTDHQRDDLTRPMTPDQFENNRESSYSLPYTNNFSSILRRSYAPNNETIIDIPMREESKTYDDHDDHDSKKFYKKTYLKICAAGIVIGVVIGIVICIAIIL